MASTPNVILISGPGGSGKSSLADYIGARCEYTIVSEDRFWSELKANSPMDTWRTLDEELIVQSQVIADVRQRLLEGNNVVLEFILYCDPPRPLLAYIEALRDIAANLIVVLLKPSAEAILSRKKIRGRANEQDTAAEKDIAVSQLKCLDSPCIRKEWLVENVDLGISETFDLIVGRNRRVFE